MYNSYEHPEVIKLNPNMGIRLTKNSTYKGYVYRIESYIDHLRTWEMLESFFNRDTAERNYNQLVKNFNKDYQEMNP